MKMVFDESGFLMKVDFDENFFLMKVVLMNLHFPNEQVRNQIHHRQTLNDTMDGSNESHDAENRRKLYLTQPTVHKGLTSKRARREQRTG